MCAVISGLHVELTCRLGGGTPTVIVGGRAGQGPECCVGAGAVDLLCRVLWLGAERGRAGDLVAVAVGGGNYSAAAPLFALPPAGGSRTERRDP